MRTARVILLSVLLGALLLPAAAAERHPRLAAEEPPAIPMQRLWRRRLLRWMILRSQLILAGRVSDMQSQWVQHPWGEVIQSSITIHPDEVLKGSLAGDLHLPAVLGGTVDGTFMLASHAPSFAPQERLLLFMRRRGGAATASDEPWEVVGGTLGKLHVDESGHVGGLDLSWAEARTEILSFVSGSRVYLPLLVRGFSVAGGLSAGQPLWPSAGALYDTYDGRKWSGSYPVVPYYIYNPGFNDPQAGAVVLQNLAIRRAAQAWGDHGQARANIKLTYAGTTTTSQARLDGKNVVIVRNQFGTVPVETYVFGTLYNISEVDMVFYDANHTFALNPGSDPELLDIQSFATREFGHFIGLASSAVPGATVDDSLPGGTAYARTLHLDDITGAKYLYGAYFELHDQDELQTAEEGDWFGYALAAGDFNGDGLDDLAVGTGRDDAQGEDTGHVSILLGAGAGLEPRLGLTQTLDLVDVRDNFGEVLAAGDFNNDGYDDLAVGTPGKDWLSPSSGVVYVYPGGPDPGIFGPPERITQSMGGGGNSEGDQFGSALAVGDFDGDGFDDLAVGTPNEDYKHLDDGVVFVFPGSASGLGNGYYIHQGMAGESGDEFDLFGFALAAGDFNGDGLDDLAVGSPKESLGSEYETGLVYVFEGSRTGPLGNGIWFDQRPLENNEAFDHFGWSLAAADFNGDGYDDLAAGCAMEDYTAADDGLVFLFLGNPSRIMPYRLVDQAPAGAQEDYDYFGWHLASGDFNGDGRYELAVGSPYEDLTGTDEGYVFICQFFDDSGQDAETIMGLSQSPAADNETEDYFGYRVVAGDFTGVGADSLAITAIEKDIAAPDGGAVFVWRWRP
jgi:hypothetical protein